MHQNFKLQKEYQFQIYEYEIIILKLFNLICFIIHPPSITKQSKLFQNLFTILNKFQELEMIQENNQITGLFMSTIVQYIGYTFFINELNPSQFATLILLFLMLHIGFFILFIKFAFHRDFTSQSLTNNFLLNYTLIFEIPVLYTSISIILKDNVCQITQNDSNRLITLLIGILNIIFAIPILASHIYFARCEKIMENNNILKLDQSIIINIINQILILLSIMLKILDQSQIIKVIVLLLKQMIYIITSIKSINERNYVFYEIISSIISIGILFQLTFFDICLICLFAIAVTLQIQENLLTFYITSKNQLNYTTVQLVEYYQQFGSDEKSKLIFHVLLRNHVCPRKSKKIETMAGCLLRQLANLKDTNKKNQNILFYCQFISNNTPLKGLIKIISVQTKDIYHKSSYHNLCHELNLRIKQFQGEAEYVSGKKNKNEHSTSLDAESTFNTAHSAEALFPSLIKVLNSKIQFWNKLINGYQNIDNFLDETLKTTEQMLKCRQEFENRFDFENNKLKNAHFSDVLTMRILQIYYSGVYTNSYNSYTLEKATDDLLKSERFKQEETLDNLQLVQNRLIILKTSLVRKRGELIYINTKAMSQFLNEKEEDVKQIKHCSQLMPKFIGQIHDNLMDNYTSNGYSKLMIQGEQSFFENLQGFIEPCSINLYNYFDGNQDFILNLILTKTDSNSDTIIFGLDGKILGFTKPFFNEAVQNLMISQQKSKSIQISQVNDFLNNNPLIAFYIPQILIQTQEFKEQIIQSQNYQLNNLKSTWQIPENHNECLQNSILILSQFRKRKEESSQQQRSAKSLTYSKYSQYSQSTQVDFYDDRDFSKQLKNQIMIDENVVIMLHPDYEEMVKKIVSQNVSQQKMLEIHYSLIYKTLKYKNNTFGYFQLSLKEYKNIINSTTLQGGTTVGSGEFNQVSKTPISSINFNTSYQYSDVRSEVQEHQEILVKEIKQLNGNFSNEQYFQDSYSADRSKIQSFANLKINFQLLKSTDRGLEIEQVTTGQVMNTNNTKRCNSNLFLQSQFTVQPLYIHPKVLDKQFQDEEVKDLENDMNLINQQKEIVDDFYEDVQQGLESNSQSVKNKSNILEKFQKSQLKQKENIADFQSNPSRTSTNSTSKEALQIVQKLYDDLSFILPLKKTSLVLFLICFGMLLSNILNVNEIDDNLQKQVTSVDNVRKPLNINYFFVGAEIQLYALLLNDQNILSLSPFLEQRIYQQLNNMYEYGREIILDHIVDVPILAEALDIYTFPCFIIEQDQRVTLNTTLHEFYSIYYELAEDLYRRNLNCTNNCNYMDLFTTGFLRQNLVVMMDFHDKLIDSITEATLETQSQVKSIFLQILLAELFAIVFLLGLQLRQWLFIDQITKHILFLISRLNETQSLEQINKLTLIKQYIENEKNNEWKLLNFSELMFSFNEKKSKKVIQIKAQAIDKNSGYKSTTALYSRIQKTYYINRINILITLILTISWTLYLMAGYLIHMQNNDDFQPSLEVTLRMVKFRHNMDAAVILASVIKSENIIVGNELQFINQSYIIETFLKLKSNLSPIINDLANVVLENANQQGQKSRFDDLLNNDLCISSDIATLIMCDPSQITQITSYKDDYRAIIKNGALGFDFNIEISSLQYNPDTKANIEELNQQQYNNFLISYSTDIILVMRQFLILLQEENSSIAKTIMQVIQAYYFGLGITLFLIYCLVSIIWVVQAQIKMNSLRQIFVLIPVELILNANIRSQAKEIHNWLY